MIPYISTSGKKTGATAYEIGEDFIVVEFYKTNYLYTYSSAGSYNVDTMKELALASSGLSSFISRNKPKYQTKFNT
ncbi:MAG: hypothetical protein ABIN97_19005 [Ginsengibacter sp.]